MKKAAIFIRVSTDHQELDNQRSALIDLMNRNNYQYYTTYEYVESGYSGSSEHLKDVIKDARLRKFDVLLVWAIDRLTRRGIYETLKLIVELTKTIEIISLQEHWVGKDPNTRELIMAVTAWIAQQESKRRSERIKEGIKRIKKAGVPVGRRKGAKDKKTRKKIGYLSNTNATKT